jgi:hypothetical protein
MTTRQPERRARDAPDLTEILMQQDVTLSAGERLRFAKQVLLGMGLLCGGIIAAYACAPENRALSAIFELVKIGALPLVTLVISFYFPNNSSK